MKRTVLLIIVVFLPILGFSQKYVPKVNIEKLNGEELLFDEALAQKGLTVVSFWATWCKPCLIEQNAINDNLIDWQDEIDFKYIAISIDDARSVGSVKTMVNGKGWEFDVFTDKNQELKRALGIVNIPHIMIVNENNQILWEHSSYKPGDEEEMWDKVKEFSK